jgi:hypothetical protein
MIPGSASALLLATAAPTGYNIERSLRFNSADSAYLSRTPASAGNRKTWTWAGWVKRSKIGGVFDHIFIGSLITDAEGIRFNSSDKIQFYLNGGSFNAHLITTQVFRDFSAWYHIAVAVDTTQATASNRVKLYINGNQVTVFDTSTYPSQNYECPAINTTAVHWIGANIAGPFYSSLYLADIHFIDGQALDPTSFGEFDTTTGVWVPKAYTGTYGTNGFHLDFADNASTTTIGYDAAGSNDWTANNLSVTAGAGNDSLVDVPTNGAQTDTGAGGEVRGNYCTWNPLAKSSTSSTFSNGNLDITTPSSGGGNVFGTFAIPASGKWYWEVTYTTGSTAMIGISAYSPTANNQTVTGAIFYYADGRKFISGTGTIYGASYTTSDVIGVAVDADAGSITFYKNNSSQGAISGTVAGLFPSLTDGSGSAGDSFVTNFGQRAFAYTAPSGFKALNTANLPAPVVTKPSDLLDVKLYTGNGSTQTISGLGFSPDLVWIKNRAAADSHKLTDTVRGATEELESDTTAAEATNADGLTQFNSDGFDLGADVEYNTSSEAYVAWAWDAGSSTVSNTDGSISSQVRANASAGFSVVTYTGTGSAGSFGHGLNVSPGLVIIKKRTGDMSKGYWTVYHSGFSSVGFMELNVTAAFSADTTKFSSAPSSTVVNIGSNSNVNQNGQGLVAYCFAPVAGYSSFGSYVGNGSADGPFVYTGFRPRWVLLKSTGTTNGWGVIDTARNTYNVAGTVLEPNSSNAEQTYTQWQIDTLSNGFKLRSGAFNETNGSGVTYIYAAFAESPFNFSRAR